MDDSRETEWLLEALRGHFGAVGDLRVQPFIVQGLILSRLYLAEMTTADDNWPGDRLSVICKMLEDGPIRTNFHLVEHFLNERLFFGELLPHLLRPGDDEASRLFPAFHFAYQDDLQCVLVLENLSPAGFHPREAKLDLGHAVVALEALGTFHALSYVAKRRDPAGFRALVARLQYPRKQASMGGILQLISVNCVHHTVKLFREAMPAESIKYSRQLEEIVDDATELYGKLYEGQEPMAVLCHGDYKKENLLFRYDPKGENPLSVKLIDFQIITYSSPAIDVFLLLFMSTVPEVWEMNWDYLFRCYHDSLLKTVSSYLKCPVEDLQEELGSQMFKKEFKNYCHHGFYISNFFIPLQNLNPRQYDVVLNAVTADGASLQSLKPVLEDMNNSYNDEMKHYVITMLQQVLRLKSS